MNVTLDIRAKGVLAAAGVLLCLILSLGSPSRAKAETLSPYCNNQVFGPSQTCYGAARTLYAVYGWGDQHAVCVGTSANTNVACSGGAGQGAYAPVGFTAFLTPWIQNRGGGNNTLHGVAYQP